MDFTVTVTVPGGVYAGHDFDVEYEGRQLTVTCPDGCGPGDEIDLEMPTSGDGGAPPQSVDVTVPDGCVPGDEITVEFDGRTFDVVVPDGLSPGMTCTVEVPSVVQSFLSFRMPEEAPPAPSPPQKPQQPQPASFAEVNKYVKSPAQQSQPPPPSDAPKRTMPMAVARAIPMNKKPVAQAVAMPGDGVLRARDGSIIETGKAPNRGCRITGDQYAAQMQSLWG